jgi:hypothetical protein
MRRALALMIVAAALGYTAPAQAQSNLELEIVVDCIGDAGRLCVGILPGGGRVAKCLMAHQRELSPACRGAMGEEAAKIQAAKMKGAAAKAAAAKAAAAKAGASPAGASPAGAGTTTNAAPPPPPLGSTPKQ